MAADRPANRSNTYALVYAACLPKLQDIANGLGYALCIHGSMYRDMDIVCVPWTKDAEDAKVLIKALQRSFKGLRTRRPYDNWPEKKPHGRLAWSFYFDEASRAGASGPYIDISVMPLAK